MNLEMAAKSLTTIPLTGGSGGIIYYRPIPRILENAAGKKQLLSANEVQCLDFLLANNGLKISRRVVMNFLGYGEDSSKACRMVIARLKDKFRILGGDENIILAPAGEDYFGISHKIVPEALLCDEKTVRQPKITSFSFCGCTVTRRERGAITGATLSSVPLRTEYAQQVLFAAAVAAEGDIVRAESGFLRPQFPKAFRQHIYYLQAALSQLQREQGISPVFDIIEMVLNPSSPDKPNSKYGCRLNFKSLDIANEILKNAPKYR